MIARILAGVSVIVLTVPATAQEQEPKAIPPLPARGTELFRGLLNFNKIEPVPIGTHPAQAEYKRTILIVYGAPKSRRQELEIASHAGYGAVLVAIRTEYDLGNLSPVLRQDYAIVTPGLTCRSETVTPESLTDEQRFQCPFVNSKPYGPLWLFRDDPSPPWNPFRGLGKIATREPASLAKVFPRRTSPFVPLAHLPLQTRDRNGQPLPEDQPFAVGLKDLSRNNHATIIMANEDVISNRMIALSETDNLPFAMKLITTLKPPGSDEKTYCVFFENGERKYRFDDVTFSVKPSSDMPPLPIPPPEMIDKLGTQVADGLADQFDRSDAANSLFNKNQRYYAYLLRILVLALAGMAILFFARRAFVNRYRNERTAMPIAPLARVKPAKGLVGQMRQDILIGGDFGPVIREYLRELFAATGLRVGSDEKAPAGLPAVHYDGRAENKPALIADLSKLWLTAYGPAGRIPLSAWKELEPMMLRVWRAAEAGRWRFAADPRGAA